MSLIGFLLRASWSTVAIAALTGFLSGACSALLIALINQAASRLAVQAEPPLLPFVGLAIAALLTSLLSRSLLIRLSQTAVHRLRMRLSHWILACPLQHLEELGANRLLATLTEDVQAISNAVFNIPFLCIDLTLIVGCLVYLGWLSGSVLLGTLVCLAVAIALAQLLLNHATRLLGHAREEQDRLFKYLRVITDGVKELKLHRDRREAFLEMELQESGLRTRDLKVKSLTGFAIASSFGELLFFIVLGLLVFGLPRVQTVPPAVMVGYVVTITYITRPLQSILQVLPGLSQAGIALRKIDRLGLALASQAETTAVYAFAPSHEKPFKQIQLQEIVHSYRGDRDEMPFTLGPIDLSFQAGELIFIVGGNGSGKSTLAKLLTGLYSPASGQILLNGEAITAQNREAYRQLFSTVFSDFFLFERLLGIAMPNLDAQAQKYLHQLQLDQKVQIQFGQLSTLDLSQGQRKRLALLTAYLEDRPIYLFDEWAADQDPYFRDIFYKQILDELKSRGKTIFVISHDDRYFHLADRLIKLDYGKLVRE
ncbi:MAG: cyclic peptide export ABC transporter [Oculatellaceae cyanobacterium Prado106]|jgi:putative ATP-binding cassette transporter|nr:cyclic peptide export ABC transporter [Oculatellaceae cyanobacterium Prado106]